MNFGSITADLESGFAISPEIKKGIEAVNDLFLKETEEWYKNLIPIPEELKEEHTFNDTGAYK